MTQRREVSDSLLHVCCLSFWLQSAGLGRGSHTRSSMMPFWTRAAACRHTVEDSVCDLQEMSRNDRCAALLLWATYETLGVTCRHALGLADVHYTVPFSDASGLAQAHGVKMKAALSCFMHPTSKQLMLSESVPWLHMQA